MLQISLIGDRIGNIEISWNKTSILVCYSIEWSQEFENIWTEIAFSLKSFPENTPVTLHVIPLLCSLLFHQWSTQVLAAGWCSYCHYITLSCTRGSGWSDGFDIVYQWPHEKDGETYHDHINGGSPPLRWQKIDFSYRFSIWNKGGCLLFEKLDLHRRFAIS